MNNLIVLVLITQLTGCIYLPISPTRPSLPEKDSIVKCENMPAMELDLDNAVESDGLSSKNSKWSKINESLYYGRKKVSSNYTVIERCFFPNGYARSCLPLAENGSPLLKMNLVSPTRIKLPQKFCSQNQFKYYRFTLIL